MATVAQVLDGTLRLLGVLELGKTINSTDETRMQEAYDTVFADLKNGGIATWAALGPVPDDMRPHLQSLMAIDAIDDFYVSDSRYQRIVNKSKIAKREMRRLGIPDYESLDEVVDY